MLGPGHDEQLEVNFLGREIRWRPGGIELDADTKHVIALLEEMDMAGSRPVSTPGVSESQRSGDMGGVQADGNAELVGEHATRFRRMVARLNYLSQDRADISYSVKEVARRMAAPRSAASSG